jgi:hypothetical protein
MGLGRLSFGGAATHHHGDLLNTSALPHIARQGFASYGSRVQAGVRSRTAFARVRVTLFCWRQEQEGVMTEQSPKNNPGATDRPQPTEAEQCERVKAHIRAALKRLTERLRQGT